MGPRDDQGTKFITWLQQDAAGNLYAFQRAANRITKITPAGVASVILDEAGDGMGNAFECAPYVCSMLVLPSGDVYATAGQVDSVFHVDSTGVISKIIDATGDGSGNTLDLPVNLAVDASGNVFVEGYLSGNVFRVSPGGTVTHLLDVTNRACFATDAAGNTFIGISSAVLRHDAAGTITTILDGTGDGTHAFSGLACPTVDAAGNVYVSGEDTMNVFQVTPAGAVTQIADASGDGAGNVMQGPQRPVVDSTGIVYVPDNLGFKGKRVFRVDLSSGTVSLLTTADNLRKVLVDAADVVYVLDGPALWEFTGAGRRLLLDENGDGVSRFALDSTEAVVVTPASVYLGGYVASSNDYRVLAVDRLCDAFPRAGCRVPVADRGSTLIVKDVPDDSKDQVTWKWTKGEETDVAAFGDPTTLDFNLCLYGGDSVPLLELSAVADSACGDSCWTPRGTTGFRLLDRVQAPDGIKKIVLKAGAERRAKVLLKARGELIPEGFALPAIPPIVAQLQASNGECWEMTYEADDVRKNVGTKLVAKGP